MIFDQFTSPSSNKRTRKSVFLAIELLLLLCCFSSIHGQECSPEDYSSLRLWLRSDSCVTLDTESRVSEWCDISGNGFTATQSDEEKRPGFNPDFFSGFPGIEFSGGNSEFLDVPDFGFSGDMSLIAIISTNDPQEYAVQYFVGTGVDPASGMGIIGSTGRWILLNDGVQYTSPNVIENGQISTAALMVDSETDSAEVRFDEDIAMLDEFQITGVDSLVIGKRSDLVWSFYGNIIEILLFNERISSDEMSCILDEIKDSYTPSLSIELNEVGLDDFCADTLNVVDGFNSYLWSTGSDSSSALIESPGLYWVEVVDVFGRMSRDTLEVSYPGNYLSDFTLCQFQDSLWNTDLSTIEFDLEWSDGSSESTFSVVEAGEYYVNVTDEQGCTFNSDTVHVLEDAFPSFVSLGDDVELCSGNSLTLLSGQDEALSITWNDNVVAQDFPVTESGQYWVEAINENGCVAQDTIEVTIIGEAPSAEFSFSGPVLHVRDTVLESFQCSGRGDLGIKCLELW